jgi:hypothetical protein
MSQAFQIQSDVTLRARPHRPGGLWSRLAAILGAKLRAARERRAIAALGPYGRRELHALLLESGAGGIPQTVWSARDWAEDARRF